MRKSEIERLERVEYRLNEAANRVFELDIGRIERVLHRLDLLDLEIMAEIAETEANPYIMPTPEAVAGVVQFSRCGDNLKAIDYCLGAGVGVERLRLMLGLAELKTIHKMFDENSFIMLKRKNRRLKPLSNSGALAALEAAIAGFEESLRKTATPEVVESAPGPIPRCHPLERLWPRLLQNWATSLEALL